MSTRIDLLIRALPLKEMESSLLARAIYSHALEVGMDTEKVREAVALASYLHRTHTRSVRSVMPRTHYIEHPLRNAVRLFRYGVTDQDVIIAAILHDTVEDALQEFYAIAMNKVNTVYSVPAPEQMRFWVYTYIEGLYGEGCQAIVEGVTNALPTEAYRHLTKAQKREMYLENVTRKVNSSPGIALVKFADFVDNGVGLAHQDTPENRGMLDHLGRKYLPLVTVFRERLVQGDVSALVSLSGVEAIQIHLDRAEAVLSRLADRD